VWAKDPPLGLESVSIEVARDDSRDEYPENGLLGLLASANTPAFASSSVLELGIRRRRRRMTSVESPSNSMPKDQEKPRQRMVLGSPWLEHLAQRSSQNRWQQN
jgi:hypothetical protein